MREDRIDLLGKAGGVGAIVAQDDFGPALLDLAPDEPDREQGDTDTGPHRRGDRVRVVGGEIARDRDVERPVLADQLPDDLARVMAVDDAVVLREILRAARPAVAGEIFRARADNPVDGGELAHDIARLAGTADADREVGPLLDEIDIVVGHGQLDPQLRMGLQELPHIGRDIAAPEHHRHVETQRAARRLAQLGHRRVGVVDIGDDVARPFVVDPSRLGQSDIAGRTVEQPRAERILQLSHLARDRGGVEPDLAPCGGETAGFNHPREQPHAR